MSNIEELHQQFLADMAGVDSAAALEHVRTRYVGKKSVIGALYKDMAQLSDDEKRARGAQINAFKDDIQRLIDVRARDFEAEAFLAHSRQHAADVTLPPPMTAYQGRHPLTQTMEYLIDVLAQMGFDVGEGPEIESEELNYYDLNFPVDHPAMDEQATFYISRPWLLRTHTSPVQIRYMRVYPELPIQMIAPGRVYRADDDPTHSPMFHQIEGLWVDRGVHVGNLKGVIRAFLKKIFHDEGIRFRPSFFPFTEPSVEVDIACVFCAGEGCRLCKNTGWLEIMGAGMVHPNVIRAGRRRDEKGVTGIAFGMGIERMTMLLFGIPDIRMLFDNDPRVLNQVGRSRRFPAAIAEGSVSK